MLLVSEKMSAAPEILGKGVLRNVTALPKRLDGTRRPAAQWMSVSAASDVGTSCTINTHRLCAEKASADPNLARDSTPLLDFDHFQASLKDSESAAPIVSARRFAAALHIDMRTLARPAHVYRNSISRLPGAESVQKYLQDALRVIRAATDISGDVRNTLFWYRNEPLPTFDCKTAKHLVSEGRTEDRLLYVTSLGAGAAG